jgi:hypothetical protein
MRSGFHLVGGDAAGAELARAFAAGFAEPRLLRGRIGLGADPNIVLAGFGVDRALLESPLGAGAFIVTVAMAFSP